MDVVLLIASLGLIVAGAEWLVAGASSIARKAGISEFVIGLTIVGFGTSCPELVVSLTGAFQGNADVAVGNVVGSNIFNVLFILGITSLMFPVTMTESNRKKDIPVTLIVTVLLIAFGMSSTLFGLGRADNLTRAEGVLFLLLFTGYLFGSFRNADRTPETDGKVMKMYAAVLLSIAGLAALIGGGELFVDSAVKIARSLGVSDKFIAVTILAGGTSLPELATSVVAAAHHKDRLALGNVLGSNVFNILFILGCSSLVTPLSLAGMTIVDAAVILLSCVLLLIWAYTGKRCRIDRWEGVVMLLCFIGYYAFLFVRG
ncbi:MAG: calcium/sodium antiporter [Bacteroidales bacterium]|nr:calcium/sodium antiporter [Bacteroidales bacterium]